MKQDYLIEQLQTVKKWLVMKSSVVPFIVGYPIRQWTVGVRERYPDYRVIDICALYARDEGSVVAFAVDEDLYIESAKKLLLHKESLRRIFEDFEHYEKRFHDIAGTLEQIKREGKHFGSAFDDLVSAYNDLYIAGIVMDGFIAYSDAFVFEMNKKYPSESESVGVLTGPYGLTFTQKERRDLLRIARDVQEKGMDMQALLLEHQKKYHWMQNNYKHACELPVSHFERELKPLLEREIREATEELKELESAEELHQKECKRIRDEGRFEVQDYENLLWLGKIAWWMDRRKTCNLIANHLLDIRARQLAEAHGLSYDDVCFLLPWEADSVIKGEATLEQFHVPERKNCFALVCTAQGDYSVRIGEDAEIVHNIIEPAVDEQVMEVKGAIAHSGKVTGIARIVFEPRSPGAFKEGDILVASMTRPDFLGLMKMASAFVTDEGGVTCHAAIVARELKKPCIIGTKIATKVLKDGDLVEVDAVEGVVRKVQAQ